MSDTTTPPCSAQTVFDGQEITCEREAGHPSVHLGRTYATEDGSSEVELHQWSDAQSIGDQGPVDEIPTWYQVLPLGSDVQITTNSRRAPTLCGELVGAVVDDHEQISAVMLREGIPGDSEKRVLVPWSTVETLAWEVDR